ncbi:MAG: M23 family metallopeptidase [Bacteroidales bacterium]|nr:M23 family metallopeptidase [Bacteroidales bacterium]
MNLKRAKTVLTAFFAAVSLAMSAQNVDTETAMHEKMHQDLLADQVNIHKEVNLLDSVTMLYRLQQEDEMFPALDLYSDSWNNDWVNPYKNLGIKLPDSLKIDVSEYIAPSLGKVTSNFGWRRRRMHNGIDLKVQVGDTIYAAFSGKIRVRKFERRGYGYYLVVRHNNGLETVYGHLSKFLVKVDDIVKAGDPIGLGGNTGRSTGSHLHFETRLMGQVINPNDIIDFENKVAHTDTYLFTSKKAKTISGAVSLGNLAYHKVKKGDTLGAIAMKYRTSVTSLCRLNNISKKTTLRLGQKIRVS